MENAGISLRVASIENDFSTRSRDVLFAAVGMRVYPLTVYTACRRQCLVWKSLCIKAGATNASKMKSLSESWSPELTIRVIREMYMAGLPINCKAIRFDKDQSRSTLIMSITGTAADGAGVYKRAVTRFGNWTTALRSSGLKPEDIKAKRKLTLKSKYAHLPVHMEIGVDARGNGRTEEAFGFAPRTPEEILAGRHELRALAVALSKLPTEDRIIAEEVIRLLQEDSDIENLDEAVAQVGLASAATKARIETIFQAIQSSLQ